ncbi:MAG: glutamate--tRNA ligase [Candidatus Nanoarchaeia archaeon]
MQILTESDKKLVEKFALANAVTFEGKAQLGAVIGKVLNKMPELKQKINDVSKEIALIVDQVNSMSLEEQKEKLLQLWPEFFAPAPKIKEERSLKPFPIAEKGKVVMRVEPSPSGALHVGNAFVICLNFLYCKMYDGKFIIRISDTDIDKIDPESYSSIIQDAQWLTNNGVNEFYIQSDRLPIYYKWAEVLLKKNYAYVCTCKSEKWHELMLKGTPCPCRDLEVSEQLKRWASMLNGDIPEGDAVVRIKTDIKHPNPAIRDWAALRIKEAPHPRQGKKYRVWPLMNFAVAIDDYEMGITHCIRGKDHMDNEKKQKYIYDYMGWQMPYHFYVGRINFKGLEVSKSKTKQKIDRGEYSGWDDVRLPTVSALRRRGYLPETFNKWAIEVGISEADKTINGEDFFKIFDAINRTILDPLAKRYWFVPSPLKINLSPKPNISEVDVALHPDKPEKRTIKLNKNIFVSKADFEKYRGKEVRLMHLCNVILEKKANLTSIENKDIPKIQWLSDDHVKAELLMPDNTKQKGIVESNAYELPIGEIIQFERIGFARLEAKKKNKLLFVFAHK